MKNFFVILLISILCLSGCTGDRCIDADDFGFIRFVISSRYPKDQLTTKQEGNQIAPWVDSNYKVNGQPLTILVKTWHYKAGDSKYDKNTPAELSAWGPWYGQEDNFYTLSAFCVRLQECKFAGDQMCTPTKDAQIGNAPCIFKNGVGLYLLITHDDPNSYDGSGSLTEGITQHLGEPVVGYEMRDLTKRGELIPAGGINYQYEKDSSLRTKYVNAPLYFKILDRFYEDNNGQYRLVIKSGVSDTRLDPLEYLTNLIKVELFGKDKPGIVQLIYEKIINNPSYQRVVTILLSLYVMFTGASFLIGNVNFTHTELIMRLLKIIVVSMLIKSNSSWQFFHDYLFVYFVEGVDEIKDIIDRAAQTGPGSASIIGLMIAPQTMAKLFSLLFVDPLGFIYIFLFLIALYFIFMLVFKATIIYLTALITIGMIITMGPIFICFILFSITRSLFENWLRQLISYAIQPIILFTGLAFISLIVRTEIYSTLGFAVCKYDFPDLGDISRLFKSSEDLDSSIEGSFFYWWFPSPMKADKFQDTPVNILVPVDHTIKDQSGSETFCHAYECIEPRYIEFPFLDPLKEYDQERLKNFLQGKFVQIPPLLLIFVCIYLLSKFNDIAVSTAKFLTSTSGNLTNLQSIGSSAYNPIHAQINRPTNYAFDTVKKAVNRRIIEPISMMGAVWFQENRMRALRQEALNPKAMKSSVLAEVKRKYGIDYSEVNVNAGQDYYNSVDAILQKFNSSENAADFVGKKYSALQDHLAKHKFGGKDYDSLTEQQKKELDELMKIDGKKSLKELAVAARLTKDAQKAYIESFLAMSEKGHGILGKNFAFVRTIQEIKRRKEEKERLTKAKRKQRGEKIYAEWTGLKRGILTKIAGEELVDAFEGNVTSAEWHGLNYNDPRLRTHSETIQDNDKETAYHKLEMQIEEIRRREAGGQDISSPQYLAELEQQGKYNKVQQYEELTRRKLIRSVYQSLIATSDEDGNQQEPALMGETFMREKATDQQTRTMIDQVNKREKSFIENDNYLRRQEDFEVTRDKAKAYIDQMAGKTTQTSEEVQALNESRQVLDHSEKALNKIQQRKAFIQAEFRSYITDINQIRVNAQMTEYSS